VTLLSRNVVHGLSRQPSVSESNHTEEEVEELEFVLVHDFLTLAVRNSRRRLLTNQAKPFFVSTSSQTCVELSRAEEQTKPRDASETEWAQVWEYVHTWRWLLCVPYCALESVLQANVFLRELANQHAQLVIEGDMTDGTTSAAWGAAMLILREAPTDLSEQGPQVTRGERSAAANALRELKGWQLYFDAWSAFVEWKRAFGQNCVEVSSSRADLDKSRHHRLEYPNKIKAHKRLVDYCATVVGAAADECATVFEQLLRFENGWMCDVDGGEADAVTLLKVPVDEETTREVHARVAALGNVDSPGPLKRVCLPPMLDACQQLLHDTAVAVLAWSHEAESSESVTSRACRLFERNVEMVNDVANDSTGVYRCLDGQQTKQVLELVRRSSVQLLSVNGRVSVARGEEAL
jgi:hypothetical protein